MYAYVTAARTTWDSFYKVCKGRPEIISYVSKNLRREGEGDVGKEKKKKKVSFPQIKPSLMNYY